MIIYKVVNKVNGKCYIGQTTNELSVRKTRHIHEANIRKSNFVFHKALRKYGKENFIWEVIEKCNSSKVSEREIYYIKQCKSFYGYGKGYNMTTGGDGGGMRGKKHTEETKKKMRERTHTPEAIEKIRQASTIQYKDKVNFTMTGRKHTEKAKKEMSKKAMKNTNGSKTWKAIMNEKEIVINNLVKWCKDNNYSYQKANWRIKKYIDLSLPNQRGLR